MSLLSVRRLPDLQPDMELGQAWEVLVQSQPASGFMQSLAWANFKRQQGQQILHLGLFDAGKLVGGMIGYAAPRSSPVGLMVAPDGPVLAWHESERARLELRLLLTEAEALANAYGVQAMQIEPRLPVPRPGLLRNLRRAPVDLLPSETLYLDLTPPLEAILATMHPKGRYNIRLAGRHGVSVRKAAAAEALPLFYALLSAAGARDCFFVEPASFFAALANALCPVGMAQFLVAEHSGEPLAAMLLLTYGRRATYLYGAVANEKRHLMAGYALQWTAITQAKQCGCQVYDFYGYESTGDPNHLYANFSRFKRQFGGTPVRFIGAQSYTFVDRLADAVIQATREIYA